MRLPRDYEKHCKLFNSFLEENADLICEEPKILGESMRYSLLSGGKRLRPVLFFAMLEACGLPPIEYVPLAFAIEFVHTYSLIHDDLPGMDDDDFRRGKPTNHKVFGEGFAILAGDALISQAYSILVNVTARGESYRRAVKILCEASGIDGMISGQAYDLLYTGKKIGLEELTLIYERKTAALIAAPLRMACVLAKKNEEIAKIYGENLGILFQITDDLLDANGSPDENEKAKRPSCVDVLGLEASRVLADEYALKCVAALKNFDGDASFFIEMVDCVRNRTN